MQLIEKVWQGAPAAHNIIDVGLSQFLHLLKNVIYLLLNNGNQVDVAYDKYLKDLLFSMYDNHEYVPIVRI